MRDFIEVTPMNEGEFQRFMNCMNSDGYYAVRSKEEKGSLGCIITCSRHVTYDRLCNRVESVLHYVRFTRPMYRMNDLAVTKPLHCVEIDAMEYDNLRAIHFRTYLKEENMYDTRVLSMNDKQLEYLSSLLDERSLKLKLIRNSDDGIVDYSIINNSESLEEKDIYAILVDRIDLVKAAYPDIL